MTKLGKYFEKQFISKYVLLSLLTGIASIGVSLTISSLYNYITEPLDPSLRSSYYNFYVSGSSDKNVYLFAVVIFVSSLMISSILHYLYNKEYFTFTVVTSSAFFTILILAALYPFIGDGIVNIILPK